MNLVLQNNNITVFSTKLGKILTYLKLNSSCPTKSVQQTVALSVLQNCVNQNCLAAPCTLFQNCFWMRSKWYVVSYVITLHHEYLFLSSDCLVGSLSWLQHIWNDTGMRLTRFILSELHLHHYQPLWLITFFCWTIFVSNLLYNGIC